VRSRTTPLASRRASHLGRSAFLLVVALGLVFASSRGATHSEPSEPTCDPRRLAELVADVRTPERVWAAELLGAIPSAEHPLFLEHLADPRPTTSS
jgi:hypothetical protein